MDAGNVVVKAPNLTRKADVDNQLNDTIFVLLYVSHNKNLDMLIL